MTYRPQVLSIQNGGTLQNSFTTYTPVCGGTTSTGAFQSVATGVAGQELVYNGASTLPTFQAHNANAAYANHYLNFVDDFLLAYTVSTNGVNNGLGWTVGISGGNTASAQGTANNPGVMSVSTGTGSGGATWVHGATGDFYCGSGAITMTFWVALNNLSSSTQRYNIFIGALNSADFNSATPTNDGLWFQYSDNLNSGDWTYNTAAGGSATNDNSSVAATTAYQVLQIAVNAAGTSANFLVGTTLANLTSVGTIGTNIPTSATISPYMGIKKSVGSTAGVLYVDLFTMQYALTTSR